MQTGNDRVHVLQFGIFEDVQVEYALHNHSESRFHDRGLPN